MIADTMSANVYVDFAIKALWSVSVKKSEMIKKMTALLENWENCKACDRTSEDLLKMMEKEGMLPPDNGSGYPITTLIPTGEYDYSTQPIYKWDAEND